MEIVKKEIRFHGDEILTVRNDDKIYVSVKHVCNSLGMTEYKHKSQKIKLNNDHTLKGGIKLCPLETNGGIQQVLMLELDYLPIWLAKINPARFNEELKQKLLDYQLHCKDILADEFFGKREMVLPGKDDERVNPHLNDIDDRSLIIRSIEAELTKLYDELVYHYNWIKKRSETKRDEYIGNIRKAKQKHFINNGKELTTKDIDKLNGK